MMAYTHDRSASMYYVGIDFGTVYSAVSWIKVHKENGKMNVEPGLLQPEKVQDVAFFNDNQIRTQIAWDRKRREVLYGDDVDAAIYHEDLDETDRLEYLKLGLDTSEYTEEKRQLLQKRLGSLPRNCHIRSIEAIIENFLKYLFEKCLESIRGAEINVSSSRTLVDENRHIVCVLCVPVSWDYAKKSQMKDLAIRGGLPNVELIAEPDAAATFVIHQQLQPHEKNQARVFDELSSLSPILIADIGGGTGDFATFTYWGENLSLKRNQGYKATGSACGSALLNEAFLKLFVDVFGSYWRDFCDDLGLVPCDDSRQKILNMVESQFEEKKKTFEPVPGREKGNFILPMDDVKPRDGTPIRKKAILFPRRRIEEVFDQHLKEIRKHLEDQIQGFASEQGRLGARTTRIKRIVLVGGLSGSPYMRDKLQKIFHNGAERGYAIPITTPVQFTPLASVVSRGAILTALHKQAIGIRYLECSIGLGWDEIYNPKIHSLRDRQMALPDAWDESVKIVCDRVQWLFFSGERVNVEEGAKRTKQGIRRFDLKASRRGSQVVKEPIYATSKASSDHDDIHDVSKNIRPIGWLIHKLDNAIIDGFRKNGIVGTCYEKGLHGKRGKKMQYVETQYRITAELQHPLLKWWVTFPRTGCFPNEDLNDMEMRLRTFSGEDPVCFRSRTNCCATFDITRDARGTSQPVGPDNLDMELV